MLMIFLLLAISLILYRNSKTICNNISTFKDLGTPQYFLGLEINRSSDGISVCQRKYVLNLLQDTWLIGCKPHSTPMDSTNQLHMCDENLLPDPKIYRSLIGRLLYLGIARPDISFSVNKLSQFLSKPCSHHMTAAHIILKYLGQLVWGFSILLLLIFHQAYS